MVIFVAEIKLTLNDMRLRIKELCLKNNITQKELAAKIGASEVTLSRATNGNTSLDLVDKIAAALGVSVSELFEPPHNGVITCPNCGAEITLSASLKDSGNNQE